MEVTPSLKLTHRMGPKAPQCFRGPLVKAPLQVFPFIPMACTIALRYQVQCPRLCLSHQDLSLQAAPLKRQLCPDLIISILSPLTQPWRGIPSHISHTNGPRLKENSI